MIDLSTIKSPTREEIEKARIDVVSHILEKEIQRLKSVNSVYEDHWETMQRQGYIAELKMAIELWQQHTKKTKMKYYQISFPGEHGQHVEEIWSEKQILDSYYTYWCGKMIQNVPNADLSKEKCIEDWCVVHWAMKVSKPDWMTE